MWAQVWDGHLESQKNPDWLKRSIHVDRIWVQSRCVYIYARLRGLIIWAYCIFPFKMSFLLRIVEGVTTISKLQSLTLVRTIDCTLPNKATTLLLADFAVTFLKFLLPPPDISELLSSQIEAYELNLSAITWDLVMSTPNIVFLYKRIVQSWIASMTSYGPKRDKVDRNPKNSASNFSMVQP